MRGLRILPLLVMAVALWLTPKSYGQALVVEISDAHSSYDRLPDFIRSFSVLKTEYLERTPGGEVVVIVNGDFSGLSLWSRERGWIGMQALAALSREARVIHVLGNHDGFDWSGPGTGNSLVLEHLRFLKQKGVEVVGSNLELSPEARKLISPFVDLETRSGRTMRFVGLGLEDFHKKSNWDSGSGDPVILKVKPAIPVMKNEVERAISEHVQDLVFFQHVGHVRLAEQIEKLNQELGTKMSESRLKMPVAFAAHDHIAYQGQVSGTLVVDSQSDFDLTAVEIHASGEVVSARFLGQAEQARLARNHRASGKLERFANGIERVVESIRSGFSRVVGQSAGFPFIKTDLKEGRNELGVALAESLRAWGESVRGELERKGTIAKGLPVVSFYNSSSYRRDSPIEAGELTVGLIQSFYPFPGNATLHEVSGEELAQLYTSLRKWRLAQDGMYTPQLSANLAEGPGLTLGGIEPKAKYLLALDSWLSRNGYHIEEYDRILGSNPSLAAVGHSQALVDFAPQAFARRSMETRASLRCERFFSRAAK